MCPREAIPEPWRSFLNELNRIATSTVRLDCIDFVVTMPYGLSRPTADVDVLETAPPSAANALSQVAMLGGPLFKKYGVYLDRVTVVQPPYEYESRLQEMFPGALAPGGNFARIWGSVAVRQFSDVVFDQHARARSGVSVEGIWVEETIKMRRSRMSLAEQLRSNLTQVPPSK